LRMKKLLILVYSALLLILIVNIIYYTNLYNRQISYITTLLGRQAQIVGLSVDDINNNFSSDLNEIIFTEDLGDFFKDTELQNRVKEKIKLFFSKYQDMVTDIRIFDNEKNEFTLKRDEESGEWLEQKFILHSQNHIHNIEQILRDNNESDYIIPFIKNNVAIGNIVVKIDYEKYFRDLFSVFNLKDYQWQWVMSDSGEIIYDNAEIPVNYSGTEKIVHDLKKGNNGDQIHNAIINETGKNLISSYYSTTLLQRDIGLVFSAPADRFQKYIFRNSIFIVLATLIIIQTIIWFFLKYIKEQKKEKMRLIESEKMFFRLIEEMPVAVILHDRNRKILKVNKRAASLFSYEREEDMEGEFYPEESVTKTGYYFARNLGSTFNPEQFIILPGQMGETILYRNSLPLSFNGEEAVMELLTDVTLLETARKKEAKANVAKSEFLARMSYEIKTPLNGIIGITDVLSRYEMNSEIKDAIGILRRSTEILLNIINDILDFSKIETGQMVLDEKPFNFREEIAYCSELAKTFTNDKELVFKSIIEKNVPENIIADPFRIRQILTNLIIHSVTNTDKGEIILKCRTGNENNGFITLEFELLDTGHYFNEDTLQRLFGDTIDNNETRVIKNNDKSVLGAILARQLIKLMGGDLLAESPSGLSGNKGTKISFSLVVCSSDRIIKDVNLEEIDSFSKIKAMVITGQQNRDEEIITLLHKSGMNISLTTFQKNTLEQIKTNLNSSGHRYNLLIIVDENDFDAFEAAQAIWEKGLSKKIIVQLISARDIKGNYRKCISLGIDKYILKPVDNVKLTTAVQECFPFLQSQQADESGNDIKKDIKILIVEDNKMNLKMLGTMLQTLGYKYDTSEDGYDAYLKATKNKYDLIFMDLFLPEMDGFESSRKILEHDNSVLIAAFTADTMPETKKKSELSGIREFIAKPVRIDELRKLFVKHFKAD